MNATLSTIADICGILGFVIGIFALGGVIRINRNNKKVKNSVYQEAKGIGNKQHVTTNKP